jgi:DNA-binding transcriptional LysR family regulator
MDRLSNIIAFVTVAETHSFAEAARRLNLANSVVSKRIKDLEAYLGARLLQRTTRHVALTDAGYEYFDHARRLINELAEVEENLRYRNENPVGDVKVSAPVSFGSKFMGPPVASFLEKYPDVSVRLFLGDRAAALTEEGFDLAIRIGGIGVENTSLITRKLAESRRVCVAAPGYLAKHGRPAVPQDLSRHNCLLYSGMVDGQHWPFMVKGRRLMQPVAGRFTSDNGTLLLQAAQGGCGIAMLPTFIAGPSVNGGALEIVLEDYEEPPMKIEAVYVQQRHLSARTRKFIDHLAEYFSGFSG